MTPIPPTASANGPAPPDPDAEARAFARILVERALLAAEEVEEALAERIERAGRGEVLSLGQILIKRGRLAGKDFVAIAREVESRRRFCPLCGAISYPDPAGGSSPCAHCGAASPPPAGTPGTSPPSALGKYRILRELGRGGMGVVYEAEDPTLRRRIALKVLHTTRENDRGVKRFEREARAGAHLSHPNIVAVHEIGSVSDESGDGTYHFIAMEFVEGRTLRSALAELGMEERVRVLRDVAAGIGHAHERGVVHRDVKPDNVLLSNDGRAVVTDFGLATLTQGVTRLTRSGALIGTPSFMAPEQVRGENRKISPATDVWSLGVILYEALTGKLPFTGAVAPAVFSAILSRDPVPPRQISARVAPALEAICRRCLEKDPGARYPDGRALAEDLDRYLRGETVRVRQSSRLRRKIPRRLPVGLVAAVVAAACLAIAIAVISSDDPTARPSGGDLVEKAALAYAEGDLDGAEAGIRRALEASPDDAAARYWSGRLRLRSWFSGRDVPEARRIDGAVVFPFGAPDPDAPALREIEEALAGTRGQALGRALAAFAAGRLEEALEAFEAEGAREAESTRWEFDLLAAHCLYRLRRFDRAAALLDGRLRVDAAAIGPLWTRTLLARGLEARRTGGDALELYERAAESGRALRRSGLDSLGRVLEATAWILAADDRRGRDPEDHVEAALGALRDVEGPISHVLRGDAHAAQAAVYRERGRLHRSDPYELRAAIEEYDRAIEAEPRSLAARLRRADAYRARWSLDRRADADRREDAAAAEADYAVALEVDPASAPAEVGLAWARAARERGRDVAPAAAIASWSAEIEMLVGSESILHLAARARARVELGRFLYEQRRPSVEAFAAAVADLDEAIALDPRNPELLRRRGSARVDLAVAARQDRVSPGSALEDGLRDADDAIGVDGGDSEAWSLRGCLRRERASRGSANAVEEFVAGIQDLRRATELRPDRGDHLYNKGLAERDYAFHLRAQGKESSSHFEAAMADLVRAAELDPTWIDAYRLKAMALQALGQFEDAATACETAIRLDPEYASRTIGVHYSLANARLSAGIAALRKGQDASVWLEGAVAAASDGLAIMPEHAELHCYRGFARAYLGDHLASRGLDSRAVDAAALEDLADRWVAEVNAKLAGDCRLIRAQVEKRLGGG